jgi:hypothetical protein
MALPIMEKASSEAVLIEKLALSKTHQLALIVDHHILGARAQRTK